MTFITQWRDDFWACLSFFTRIPTPSDFDHDAVDFSRAARAVPLAGAVPSALGAVLMAVSFVSGAPSLVAAGIAFATLILLTGALHEDGLADTCDGIGGGRDVEKKLIIMRDSRLGSYGALAIVFSVLFRVGTLAALLDGAGVTVAAALFIAAAAVSRFISLSAMRVATYARTDGVAKHFSPPTNSAFIQGFAIIALLLFMGTVIAGVPPLAIVLASIGCGVSFVCAIHLIHKQIGGFTGDTIGAGQQIAEIAFLVFAVMAF